MLASIGCPKKIAEKCWARNDTKSGSCGDKFSHGHDFRALVRACSYKEMTKTIRSY